ncbi:hypothetical protein SEA_LILPHARAOH_64 [Mycobacterium phage LilPharaoh]|uniref:Uncharacterized protein n=1 Tax=Mycobacterium phage Amelie TaxID=1913035 RepID=A0A1J0GQ17_9CAUD|nr:hypothetical protein AVV01_gp65 [Mycobacterium phage Enkosi]YP_009952581.1 hypothetical protein I5G92_gp63 [Mycobacterium phage Amelie]ATN90517.1 hypothetical protein SEA_LILPHARAOH_64 [Mycobacterium phage LilPharaoh]AVP42641.1 hypothetical protein SEA_SGTBEANSPROUT_64 [Mycobacterium phage SgtBeansprout]AXC37169.1 hypothetical protein SEA_BIGLEBOPS_63 [Mycobacterium phage Biglebops]QGJ93348.1 hypothetical protein PBI_MDAVU_64 [Mycobacterium phage Mdavu]UQS94463.1 hypothetical protein SEA_N
MKVSKVRAGMYKVSAGGREFVVENVPLSFDEPSRWVWRVVDAEVFHDGWIGDFRTKREAVAAIADIAPEVEPEVEVEAAAVPAGLMTERSAAKMIADRWFEVGRAYGATRDVLQHPGSDGAKVRKALALFMSTVDDRRARRNFARGVRAKLEEMRGWQAWADSIGA